MGSFKDCVDWCVGQGTMSIQVLNPSRHAAHWARRRVVGGSQEDLFAFHPIFLDCECEPHHGSIAWIVWLLSIVEKFYVAEFERGPSGELVYSPGRRQKKYPIHSRLAIALPVDVPWRLADAAAISRTLTLIGRTRDGGPSSLAQ